MLVRLASRVQRLEPLHAERAREIVALGFRPYDALHLACAESSGATVLLTTDDRMLRRAARVREDLRVRVANPLTWMTEETTA